MDSEFQYMQRWLERYPDCKIDDKKPIDFLNFDWRAWEAQLQKRCNMIFWAITQSFVGGNIRNYWRNRNGYSRDGLKAEHAQNIITNLLGSDYLRGNNIINRMQRKLDTKQPHLKNQDSRLENITRILDRVYGVNDSMAQLRNRTLTNNLESGTDSSQIQAYLMPVNFIMAARQMIGMGGHSRPRNMTYIEANKTPEQKNYEKKYMAKLQPNVKFIPTTQDTPKMVSDLFSKITKVVDYDRIFLMPCLRPFERGLNSMKNMVRNNKKGTYNFDNSDIPGSGGSARQNGAIIIIPAGYSIPPMKFKHFFLMGARNKRELVRNLKNPNWNKNNNRYWGGREYDKTSFNKRVPAFRGIINPFTHEKTTSNRYAIGHQSSRISYYGSESSQNVLAGSSSIIGQINKIWALFSGHSIYPTYSKQWAIESQNMSKGITTKDGIRTRPFYYDIQNRVNGVFAPYRDLQNPYNIDKKHIDDIHKATLKVHKNLKNKGYGDIVIGSPEFYRILKPALSDDYRRQLISTMYDNHYVEIDTRGALYTMNYIVSGIPIFKKLNN